MDVLMTFMQSMYHLVVTTPSFSKLGLDDFYEFPRKTYSVSSPASNPDADIVIVFVHGRNSNNRQFKRVIEHLENQSERDLQSSSVTMSAKKYQLLTVDLGQTAYTTFKEDADTLASIIQSITIPIMLIGVSKGGVTCMELASRGDDRIKSVLTISSPLKGTKAVLPFEYLPESYGVVASEFKYEGNVIRDIQNRVQKTYKGDIFHVVPSYDHLIIPTSSAYYETTPKDNIYQYNGYDNHCLIQSNPEVLEFIKKAILAVQS